MLLWSKSFFSGKDNPNIETYNKNDTLSSALREVMVEGKTSCMLIILFIALSNIGIVELQ